MNVLASRSTAYNTHALNVQCSRRVTPPRSSWRLRQRHPLGVNAVHVSRQATHKQHQRVGEKASVYHSLRSFTRTRAAVTPVAAAAAAQPTAAEDGAEDTAADIDEDEDHIVVSEEEVAAGVDV